MYLLCMLLMYVFSGMVLGILLGMVLGLRLRGCMYYRILRPSIMT
nr:MAG TPA: hypothetical protein [Caudoviricetes sp.]